MNANPINICYCTDKKFLALWMISFRSFIESKSIDSIINLYLLVQGFDQAEIDILQKYFSSKNITEKQVNVYVINANSCKYQSTMSQINSAYPSSVFIRLAIPSLLRKLDKVLYIDCDTIIQKDLSDIFNYEIGDNVFGAVPDFGIALNKKHIENGCNDRRITWLNDLKYIVDYDKPYVNSGILLYNLSKIRTLDFKNICQTEYVTKNNIYKFPDQDLINFAFKNQIAILPLTYNNQFSLFETVTTSIFYNVDALNQTFSSNYNILTFNQDSYILHYSMNKNMMFLNNTEYPFFRKFIFQNIFRTMTYFDLIQILSKINMRDFNSIVGDLSEKSLKAMERK